MKQKVPVMDEATKEQLKWKFYRLAIILNAIVLLVAIGVIALLKLPGYPGITAGMAMFALAAGLGMYFRMQYQSTRKWLDEQD